MSRLTQENLVAAALLVFFGGVIWLCQDFGPRARMIPLPLAVFGIVLTVIQILWQNLRSTEELRMDMIQVRTPGDAARPAAGTQAASQAGKPISWRLEAGALGIVVTLVALILVTRQYSWRTSLVYTGVLTAVVYFLFVVALQIQPYHGMLAPLVEQFR